MYHRLNLVTLTLCSTTASAQETSTALTSVQNAPAGVIIGGVIGGVLVLTIIIGSTLWYQRKLNRPPLPTEGRPTVQLPLSSQLSVTQRKTSGVLRELKRYTSAKGRSSRSQHSG